MDALRRLPLFVHLLIVTSCVMLLPAIHALRLEQFLAARSFFYTSMLVLLACLIIGLTLHNRSPFRSSRAQLVTLIGAYFGLPLLMAMPMLVMTPGLDVQRAYFEMVSSLTTTGATIFSDHTAVSEVVHLWRALVAWMGGLFALVIALAVMEPLNLGGFEIRSTILGAKPGQVTRRGRLNSVDERVARQVRIIAPIYVGLTLLLGFALILLGDRPFVAICHAMSILSTSGISPIGGLGAAPSGYGGEMFMVLFLVAALSHRVVLDLVPKGDVTWLKADAEFRLAFGIVLTLGLLLFLRHWVAAFDVNTQEDFESIWGALWGTFFTTISFLTTTGFESRSWSIAESWSGLETSGIFLIGLVTIGGGIATTAGGVKLLRVYALYKHGLRELEKLAHPSSIGGSGTVARRIRREGAFTAWMFLMLFVVTLALVMLALGLTGAKFEDALLLATAALSTTGPLVSAVSGEAEPYALLSAPARLILCFAMILGRLESLAVLALLNPGYWRN